MLINAKNILKLYNKNIAVLFSFRSIKCSFVLNSKIEVAIPED